MTYNSAAFNNTPSHVTPQFPVLFDSVASQLNYFNEDTQTTIQVPLADSENQNTGFNIARGTLIQYDNLIAQIKSDGTPQLSAGSGNFSAFWSWTENIKTKTPASGTNSGATLTAGTWTNVGTTDTLGSGGDTVVVHVIDNTNSHIYRVTYLQTVGTSNGTVIIEKFL